MTIKLSKAENYIIAYSRDELDEFLSSRLGLKVKATDEQWDQVFNYIHNNDEGWGYITDAVCKAEEELISQLINSLK